MKEIFRRFSIRVTEAAGSAGAFVGACGFILLWLITGPKFHFSDTWQLVVNTGTTVVTFLMVFLIQYSQNRDTKAVQLKLNELLLGVKDARNELVDLEEMSDQEIEKLRDEYRQMYTRLHGVAEERSKKGAPVGRAFRGYDT